MSDAPTFTQIIESASRAVRGSGKTRPIGLTCPEHHRWVGEWDRRDPCWGCVWPQALKAAKP